jgi:hypothetical protein
MRQRESVTLNTPTRQGPIFYTFMSSSGSALCMTSIGISSEDRHLVSSSHEDSDWIYPEQEIIRILVDHFRSISEVKSICASFGSQEITIWTLLERYDRAARERVYAKELEVCRKLRIYDFDFRATSIDLVSADELVRSGSHEIYRKL